MKPNKITIHCSATPNGQEVPIKTIDKWHRDRGFRRIGYHYIVQPCGKIEAGRPEWLQGAHVSGANKENLGLCLIGNDRFTKAQFWALAELVQKLCRTWGIDRDMIFCHYEFESAKAQGKTCPNIPKQLLMKWLFPADRNILDGFILDH